LIFNTHHSDQDPPEALVTPVLDLDGLEHGTNWGRSLNGSWCFNLLVLEQ